VNGRPEVLRLFVAIELGGEALRVLNDLQHQLQRRGLAGVRWVRPEGVHLTLKFLGETPAALAPDVEQAIARAVKGIPPHEVRLDALGSFGSRTNPRVLWVGLAGDLETLGRLQQQVDRELAAAGFPPEDRRFSAHLTLARVPPEKGRDVAGALSEAVSSAPVPATAIPVAEVSLMRSRLGSGGAVYTRLFSAPLD